MTVWEIRFLASEFVAVYIKNIHFDRWTYNSGSAKFIFSEYSYTAGNKVHYFSGGKMVTSMGYVTRVTGDIYILHTDE